MNFSAGTQIYIGAPARPLPAELTESIGRALGEIPGIVEAHLPLMFVEGKIDPPAQILVVVWEATTHPPASKISEVLSKTLPTNFPLDVFEVEAEHELLPTVRKAGCELNLRGRVN